MLSQEMESKAGFCTDLGSALISRVMAGHEVYSKAGLQVFFPDNNIAQQSRTGKKTHKT